MGAGRFNDRKCSPLTMCDYDNEWEEHLPAEFSDRDCTPLTVCSVEQKQYISITKTKLSDRTCADWRVCRPGEHQVTSPTLHRNRVCTDCAKGHFTKLTNSLTCKKCAKGHFQRNEGRTSCDECSIGTYQNSEGQNSCETCNMFCGKGHWHTPCGDTPAWVEPGTCEKCKPGTHKQRAGVHMCSPCAAGTVTEEWGSRHAARAMARASTSLSLDRTAACPQLPALTPSGKSPTMAPLRPGTVHARPTRPARRTSGRKWLLAHTTTVSAPSTPSARSLNTRPRPPARTTTVNARRTASARTRSGRSCMRALTTTAAAKGDSRAITRLASSTRARSACSITTKTICSVSLTTIASTTQMSCAASACATMRSWTNSSLTRHRSVTSGNVRSRLCSLMKARIVTLVLSTARPVQLHQPSCRCAVTTLLAIPSLLLMVWHSDRVLRPWVTPLSSSKMTGSAGQDVIALLAMAKSWFARRQRSSPV